MERLTKRDFQGNKLVLKNSVECTTENIKKWSVSESAIGSITIRGEAVDKLARYEDLEEQGLLLKLPCKVGDTVYAYCSEFGIIPYVVDCIVINEHITFQCSSYSDPIGDCPSECLDEIEPDITDFGKTAFLTQAEAERKSKEMKL